MARGGRFQHFVENSTDTQKGARLVCSIRRDEPTTSTATMATKRRCRSELTFVGHTKSCPDEHTAQGEPELRPVHRKKGRDRGKEYQGSDALVSVIQLAGRANKTPDGRLTFGFVATPVSKKAK